MKPVARATSPRALACAACGALQLGAAIGSHEALHCAVCDSTLPRRAGRSLKVALACALATLLLLIAANTQTFLTTAVFGVSRQSHLLSSVTGIVGEGDPELGFAIGLFAIVFPLLHIGLLVAALATLRLGRRPHWLGRVLRAALSLRTWAMGSFYKPQLPIVMDLSKDACMRRKPAPNTEPPNDLFIAHHRDTKLESYSADLNRMGELVNFTQVAAAVDAACPRPDMSKGGRPPYPTLVMVKLLFVQALYNLSDEETEHQVLDRRSFPRFCGLADALHIPDARTVWLFKQRLVKGGLGAKAIFDAVAQQLQAHG